MRTPLHRIALAIALILVLAPAARSGDAAPRVLEIVPASGAVDVPAGPGEIRITFSEPMTDGSWSLTGGGPTFPRITAIAYDAACTVLTVKVVLEPGRTYRFGLNSPAHRNFVSAKGVPLEPVVVTFRTAGEPATAVEPAPDGPKLEFDLEDVHGLRVRSQDYAGVPIFLAFGAAW